MSEDMAWHSAAVQSLDAVLAAEVDKGVLHPDQEDPVQYNTAVGRTIHLALHQAHKGRPQVQQAAGVG